MARRAKAVFVCGALLMAACSSSRSSSGTTTTTNNSASTSAPPPAATRAPLIGHATLRNSVDEGDPDAPAVGDTTGTHSDGASGQIEGRASWFTTPRAYPGVSLDVANLREAYRRTMFQPRARSLVAAASLPSLPWSSIGPSPIQGGTPNIYSGSTPWSGRITSIANSPTDPAVAYAGAAAGGVWKTTDSGAHWSPVFDGQVVETVGALAVDPTNANDVWVGTGEGNDSGDTYAGVGLFHSADGGVSWTKVNGTAFDNCTTSKIIVLPDAAHTVFAAITDFSYPRGRCAAPGLYRSNADGTFSLLSTGTGMVTDVVAQPTTLPVAPNAVFTLYAGVVGSGVWRSLDSGSTWSQLVSGLPPASSIGRVALAVTAANPNRVYAAMGGTLAASFTTLGVWTSADAGSGWSQIPQLSNFCGLDVSGVEAYGQCEYDLAVAADPTDQNIVYVGGIHIERWNGSTMADIGYDGVNTASLHVDIHALSFDSSDRLWIGNDGGVYRKDPGSADADVVNLNAGLSVTQFIGGISGSLAAGQPLIGGTQDNGSLMSSSASCGSVPAPCWTMFQTGDGGYSGFDAASSMAYSSYTYGETYAYPYSGGSATAQWCMISSEATHTYCAFPGIPNSLFYAPMTLGNGGTRVFVSGSDKGIFIDPVPNMPAYFQLNYLSVPNDLSNGPTGHAPVVTWVTDAPSDSQTVYVGYSSGAHSEVEASTDLGSTWPHTSGTQLPNRFISAIAVHPTDPATAWVAISGYGSRTPGAPGHVFVTHDRGTTWTNVSGNLPDVPVSAVKVDTRTSPATLYAATDTGVFWSQDSGVTWSAAASGIPATIITDVLIDTAGDTLVASTHGRGMYTTPLPSTPPTAAVATPAGAKAGDVVTITGTDLEYTRGVTVNGMSVAFGIDSATSIHFTVPLAATSGPIVVTTTGGSATAATSYTVTPTVPLPPTTPTATAYNGQVVLAWTAPAAGASTITGYQVQRSTNGIAWTTLTSAAPLTRTYTATGLTNGTTYRFRVAAHNASGWGDFSPAVSVAPKTVPTVPGTPTATAYNGQVVLVWGAPSSAGSKPITTYRIQRSTNGVAWTTVTSTAPLTRTYTAVGLVNGTTYQFRVSALNAVGQSNWSAVVKSAPKAVPTAPRSPLATVASGKVTLKWTAPSSPGSKPITAYRIQRSTNGVTWTTITSSAPLSRVFVAGGLVNNTTYRFRIAAISSLGASNWSNVVTAKPHA